MEEHPVIVFLEREVSEGAHGGGAHGGVISDPQHHVDVGVS